MKKKIILVGILFCLSLLGYSTDRCHKNFQQFVKNFSELTLPYHTRSIEESKTESFFGERLRNWKILYITLLLTNLKKAIGLLPRMPREGMNMAMRRFYCFLTGECENGSSLSPLLELCTYKTGGSFNGKYARMDFRQTEWKACKCVF